MTKSISVITKSRGRPKTTGMGTLVGVRVLPNLLSALDSWIAAQPEPKPTRPEAIRYALRDWLIFQGILKSPDDPEGAN
jgi:hypothetical protein